MSVLLLRGGRGLPSRGGGGLHTLSARSRARLPWERRLLADDNGRVAQVGHWHGHVSALRGVRLQPQGAQPHHVVTSGTAHVACRVFHTVLYVTVMFLVLAELKRHAYAAYRLQNIMARLQLRTRVRARARMRRPLASAATEPLRAALAAQMLTMSGLLFGILLLWCERHAHWSCGSEGVAAVLPPDKPRCMPPPLLQVHPVQQLHSNPAARPWAGPVAGGPVLPPPQPTWPPTCCVA